MRLEAKTEMCVPYGTEATVYGSQIGKHPLDRETFLSKKQETRNKWIWRHDCVPTMWLSELEIFAMFWDLKNYSITVTDIL